jgi:hypothetical protein
MFSYKQTVPILDRMGFPNPEQIAYWVLVSYTFQKGLWFLIYY